MLVFIYLINLCHHSEAIHDANLLGAKIVTQAIAINDAFIELAQGHIL